MQGTFSTSVLVSGSPWYAIRNFGGNRDRPDRCGNKYSFFDDGSAVVVSKSVDATEFETFNITYTFTDSGVLTLLVDGQAVDRNVWEFNNLSSTNWSANRTENNDAGAYLETAFSDRAGAISFASDLGTNCESNLAQ